MRSRGLLVVKARRVAAEPVRGRHLQAGTWLAPWPLRRMGSRMVPGPTQRQNQGQGLEQPEQPVGLRLGLGPGPGLELKLELKEAPGPLGLK
mmetsp:Transcript_18812/g.41086  ORF Transcript_18812/g.41086 Transcript_18812/m.41086 type:complete len:92 (-) Transcript_18812:1819-2094(-)